MDDYFFRNHVKACRNVAEDTSYLEIFNYSVRNCLTISPRTRWECLLRANLYQDPSYNTVEQHPLTMDEFDNFLKRKVHTLAWMLAFVLSGWCSRLHVAGLSSHTSQC